MKNIFYLLLAICLFTSCESSPAGESNASDDPAIHTLENIDLNNAEVLALKDRTIYQPARATQSVSSDCSELGKMDGVSYSELDTLDKNYNKLRPCFKNIRFWNNSTVYGQYKPEDSTGDYIWFITDVNGKVHYLPNAPKKGSGFKNANRIRQYKGKPVYLNSKGYLASFDLESDEEEIIINTQVGKFVILPKDNGEHIAYHDLAGGKLRRPDGSVESIPEINTSRFYFKNSSNDLTYIANMKFKNMIMDATGNILERSASSVPVALQNWYDNPVIGQPPPAEPLNTSSMEGCDKADNLLICGNKGFVLADSSADIAGIDWYTDFQVYNNAQICLTENFIYVSSDGSFIADNITHYVQNITQITKDFSFEHIITNVKVESKLACLENGRLLVSGYNRDFEAQESFHFDPTTRVKTIITESITDFIK